MAALTDSPAGRIIGALVAPVKTFESLAQKPSWVLALVVTLLCAIGVSAVVVNHTDFAGSIRQQMEKQATRSGQSLSAEEMDSRVAMGQKFATVAALAGPPIWIPLSFLLMAVVFWLGLRMLGGEFRYSLSFAVCLHALLPSLLLGLLTIPVALGRSTITVDELRRGIVTSSAAAFAPDGASPMVVALLSSLDLFSFWSLALLVIGYRAASKARAGAVAGVVIGIWILYVLGKVGFAALSPQ
jgi:hypothetical protein